MCKKIYKPREAICLLLFSEARNAEEIKKALYGKRNSRLPQLLRELRNEGKIKTKLSKDNRYHIYQTETKTLLNYIISELKKKDIALTPEEKTKLLKILKQKSFKEFVRDFVNSFLMDVKSEHFTFSNLIFYFSIKCIHTYNVGRYMKAKCNIDPSDPEITKGFSEEKLSEFELVQLGYNLLAKLGNLSPRAYVINYHYERFIDMVETANRETKEFKKEQNNIENGNGHGLS